MPDPTRLLLGVSPVSLIYGSGTTTSGGNFSTGCAFIISQTAVSVNGCWVYWANFSSVTLKAALWRQGGSVALASGTLAVNTVGFYYIPFGSPYVTTDTDLNVVLFATMHETGGTFYTHSTAAVPNRPNVGSTAFPPTVPLGTIQGNAYVTWLCWNNYSTGDAIPNTTASAESYPVEPVFQTGTLTTSGSFTQPAFGASVTISYTGSGGPQIGQSCFIEGGGYYRITAQSGGNLTIVNFTDPVMVGVTAPAGTVPGGSTILLA